MELEELKNEWRLLDGHLEGMERRMGRLTAEVATGTFRSSRDRLRLRFRLINVVAVLLPFNFWGVFCRHAGAAGLRPDAGGSALRPDAGLLLAGVTLFSLFVLVRHLLLLDRLRRIDPARQTLREACEAVVRFRRFWLLGVALGAPFAALLVVWLGVLLWGEEPGVWYGFAAGLLVGLPLGLCLFLRIRREIDALQRALESADA